MNKAEKDLIIQKLTEKNATLPCSRCGNHSFTVLDGYSYSLISDVPGNVIISGKNVPLVMVTCRNCGNVNYHALGALGIPFPETSKKGEK